MEKFKNFIDKRLEQSAGINLFYKEGLLGFNTDCIEIVYNLSDKSNARREEIIEYTVNSVLNECYRVNQYYQFSTEAKNQLTDIYTALCENISAEKSSKRDLQDRHFLNLQEWLRVSNPFAEKLYSPQNRHAGTVPCYEYSAGMQLQIMGINAQELREPVLDIGCGENQNLVKFLREKGVEAFGIDRYRSALDYIVNTDWLEFDYGINKWGTIISNLGFSNHFVHHHHRSDGNFTAYATVYMKILKSLKIGGRFYYAPSLPFIEQYLDKKTYSVTQAKGFDSTVVTRIG